MAEEKEKMAVLEEKLQKEQSSKGHETSALQEKIITLVSISGM